jgi:hypothetical protein
MKFLCGLYASQRVEYARFDLTARIMGRIHSSSSETSLQRKESQNRKAAILENARLRAVHDHYGNRSRSDNLVSHIANEQSI